MFRTHAVSSLVMEQDFIIDPLKFKEYGSSFESEVVSSVSVIPLQHKSCSVCMSFVRLGHHNRQTAWPQQVDYLGNSIIACLLACLHDQNKSGFFGEPDFFQPIRELFENFLNCSDWLDKSRPSKKAPFALIM